jgi:hypothetical protein
VSTGPNEIRIHLRTGVVEQFAVKDAPAMNQIIEQIQRAH